MCRLSSHVLDPSNPGCSAQIEMTEIEVVSDAEDGDDDGALAWGLPIGGA